MIPSVVHECGQGAETSVDFLEQFRHLVRIGDIRANGDGAPTSSCRKLTHTAAPTSASVAAALAHKTQQHQMQGLVYLVGCAIGAKLG
jgi:hypothetical protein